MAKLSDLVPVLARRTGVPQKTLGVYARHLREARLISTGGRGPGGADMTPADCSNLLMALLGTSVAKDAPRSVMRCRDLLSLGVDENDDPNAVGHLATYFGLPNPHSFGQALDCLMDHCCRQEFIKWHAAKLGLEDERAFGAFLMSQIEVTEPNMMATINIVGQNIIYFEPRFRGHLATPPGASETENAKAISAFNQSFGEFGQPADLTIRRSVTGSTLFDLCELLHKKA